MKLLTNLRSLLVAGFVLGSGSLFAESAVAEAPTMAPTSAPTTAQTAAPTTTSEAAASDTLVVVDEEDRAQRLYLYSIHHPELQKASHIFGTNHLPDPRVLDLMPLIKPYIFESDRTYTELDMMAEQAKMTAMTMLPAGTTLKDKLPEEMYEELQHLLMSKGMPRGCFDQFKVWAAASSVMLVDYMSAMKFPMDLQIQFEASFVNIPTVGLETAEEQIAIFDSFSDEEQVVMMQQMLKMFKEEGTKMFDEMIDAYMTGDPDILNDYLAKEMERDEYAELNEVFMTRALTERDKTMAERMAAAMLENPDEAHFYAIGAAHLVTEGSVVERLREKGFDVQQVDAADVVKPAETRATETHEYEVIVE